MILTLIIPSTSRIHVCVILTPSNPDEAVLTSTTISVSSKNNKKITFFSSITFRFRSHKKCHYIECACFRNDYFVASSFSCFILSCLVPWSCVCSFLFCLFDNLIREEGAGRLVICSICHHEIMPISFWRLQRVPSIYVLSRNMKTIGVFYLNFFSWWNFLYIWIGVFSNVELPRRSCFL